MAFSIDLPDFKSGMGIEAEITASDTPGSQSQLILMKDDNNYAITVIQKWDKKLLIINSKLETIWGKRIAIDNFDYPAKGEPITVRIEANSTGFDVFVNNSVVAKFPHAISVADIEKTKFFGEEGQLKKYTILFQTQRS